jgi:hypothetical protein
VVVDRIALGGSWAALAVALVDERHVRVPNYLGDEGTRVCLAVDLPSGAHLDLYGRVSGGYVEVDSEDRAALASILVLLRAQAGGRSGDTPLPPPSDDHVGSTPALGDDGLIDLFEMDPGATSPGLADDAVLDLGLATSAPALDFGGTDADTVVPGEPNSPPSARRMGRRNPG